MGTASTRALTLTAAAALLTFPVRAGADPSVATIIGLAGPSGQAHVTLKRAGGEEPASKDLPLSKGDHVVSGSDSSAWIELSEGTTVIVGPSSDLVIDATAAAAGAATRLQLLRGLLHLMVSKIYGAEKSFVLTTGNGVIGVRGTEFIVEQLKSGAGVSSVHALDGVVVLAKSEELLKEAGKSVALKPASMAQLKKGLPGPTPPEPFAIPAYLDELDRRFPTMKTLREQTGSKFAATTSPAEAKSDLKPEARQGGKRPRRRGLQF